MKIKITKKHAIIGIAVIMLIGVGFFFLGGAQSDDASAGVKVEESADVVNDTAEKTEDVADKKTNSTSEKNTSSTNKNNSNSGNKNNSNSSNSSSGSSSNSNSGSSNNTPSKPAHTHNWVAITESVYVKTIQVCSNCQQDITDNYYEHGQAHALAGESSGRYSKPIYEEKIVGYKCSCGATK